MLRQLITPPVLRTGAVEKGGRGRTPRIVQVRLKLQQTNKQQQQQIHQNANKTRNDFFQ